MRRGRWMFEVGIERNVDGKGLMTLMIMIFHERRMRNRQNRGKALAPSAFLFSEW